MSTPLATLLRAKRLKDEQALKDVAKRRAVASRAADETERVRGLVRESAALLEARRDAVYREILGRVVDLDEIELVKGRILQIESEHAKLVDAEDRCLHVQAEAEAECADAVERRRKSLKTVDKYVILSDREREEAECVGERREETEIEDLFGTRRGALL